MPKVKTYGEGETCLKNEEKKEINRNDVKESKKIVKVSEITDNTNSHISTSVI